MKEEESMYYQNNGKRDIGADLLRVILIVMIVVHHCIVHGLGLVQLRDGMIDPVYFNNYQLLLNAVCIIGVNGFFWLSGYFGINRNGRKLLCIFFVCVFYAFVWSVIDFVTGNRTVSLSTVVNLLFPIKNYWFVAVYLFLALVAPYINTTFSHASEREQLVFAGILFITSVLYGFVFNMAGIGNGYTVFQGITMYAIGSLCKCKREILLKHRLACLLIFTACVMSLFALALILVKRGDTMIVWRLFAYNNPIVMLSAVCFCLLFVSSAHKLPGAVSNCIVRVSRVSLAVYLITDHVVARKIIYIPLQKAIGYIAGQEMKLLAVLLYALLLTTTAFAVEVGRMKVVAAIKKGFGTR